MSDSYGTYDPATRPGRKATTPEGQPKLLAEDGRELPAFDERHREALRGLLYIGALTDSFTWLGHNFVIRTLGLSEQLAISMVVKPYVGSPGEQLAYTTAVVALATDSVDGEALPTPYREDRVLAEWAQQRARWVQENWFSYTIAKVFEKYLELEDTAQQVVDAMGKALTPAPSTSTPGSNDS